MAEAREPDPVKLICGMIAGDASLFGEAAEMLTAAYGELDDQSEVTDFDFTHYYDSEMGSPLYRRFISFRWLVPPEALADVKVMTNDIEQKFAAKAGGSPERPINLDPGYVALPNLVLASMKNFSHRIYLGRGVFGEVTLMWHDGWEPLAWTFPDYAGERYHDFLTAARSRLREQLNQEKH